MCETLECMSNNLNRSYTAYLSSQDHNKVCLENNVTYISNEEDECILTCHTKLEMSVHCTTQAPYFWLFVILMSAGTIGFNVINSISDAICFDVLGIVLCIHEQV